MSKKFRLLKWYPTLPKDWKVGMEVGQGDRSTTDGHFSPCSSEYTDFAVMVDVVKNSPEFWELTKEYEIISISTHSLFGVSGSYIDIKVFKEGKQPTWTIHSVKRLSDGEIFTVGDTVINPKLRSNATFKITSFTLDCNKEHLLVLGSGAIGLRKIEKVKIPVFVTKDGVEIFHGDEFFVLFLDNVIKEPEHCVYGAYLAQNGSSHTWLTPFLNFSTREKANEFKDKILNEVNFSMLDILNAKVKEHDKIPFVIEIDLNKLKK